MRTFPTELLDANKLSRELYDFWMQTMRSDRVIGKNTYVVSVESSFDNLALDKATLLIEAVKSMVIDRFCIEARQMMFDAQNKKVDLALDFQAEDAVFEKDVEDVFSPDFSMIKQKKAYTCYYCSRGQTTDVAKPCDGCVSLKQ